MYQIIEILDKFLRSQCFCGLGNIKGYKFIKIVSIFKTKIGDITFGDV